MKRLLALLMVLAMVFTLMTVLTACNGDEDGSDDEEELAEDYEKAMEYLDKKEYEKALKAFKKLGDYEDSKKQVKKLEKQQQDYDAAQELLTGKDFEAAKEAFEALDDYRDSKEMAEKGVPYAEAMDTYNDAETVKEFLAVAAVFEELSGYQDADTMASMAYLNVCRIHLFENNDPETAMEYTDRLNDEHYEGFQTVLYEYSADSTVLDDLEQGLNDRSTLIASGETDYSLMVEAELDYMLQYEDAYFMDKNLEELIHNYIDGLQMQLHSLNGGDYPQEMAMWFEGASMRCEAITELYKSYDFLKDNEDLAESYVGQAQFYLACADIQASLEKQLWNATAYSDGNGGWYLTYDNDTGYSFTLEIVHSFELNGEFLEYQDRRVLDVGEGKAVEIYMTPPSNYEYWYIDWAFADIYDGDTKLD